MIYFFFFFQAEDGIRDVAVTGVQTSALPISFAAPEKRLLGLGQAQLHVIGAERRLFHTGEAAVAFEQRPDAGVGERIGVGDGRPVYGQTPSRGFTRALRATDASGPSGGAAFHLGSASMCTSASGRRSTFGTRVTAGRV